MGEAYRALLEDKLRSHGTEIRAWINAAGLDPHYKDHVENTFREAGACFVASRDEANFVFEGSEPPRHRPGQVVAYFEGQVLRFSGTPTRAPQMAEVG